MKRFTAIILTLVMALTLTACGGGQTSSGQVSSAESNAAASDTEKTSSDYPSKDINLIVPFNAGGGTDIVSRIYAKELNKQFPDVNIVVSNVTGASGTVGANQLASAKNDGYTLMVAPASMPVPYVMGMFEKTYKDYTPINLFASGNMALYVSGKSNYKTYEDLVNAAKENPGELRMGVSMGTQLHFASIAFQQESGTEFKQISIGGSTPKPPELISGRIDCYIASVSEGAPYIESGDFRVLAVYADERMEEYPDVPTFEELGNKYNFLQHFGIWAPKDTPEDIVEKLNEAAKATIESQEYQEQLEPLGMNASYMNASDYTDLLDSSLTESLSLADAVKEQTSVSK